MRACSSLSLSRCATRGERLPPRKTMADREFWSVNRQFGMKCPEKVLKHILGACKQSGLNETGGILVGFYEERLDCSQVTAATSAPDDSRKGRTWFLDGTTFSRHGSMISGIENE